jgi:hypothetical protein
MVMRDTPRALADAIRASKLKPRKPTEGDRPPPSTMPGRRPRLLDGQIDIFGVEHRRRQ